MADPTITGTGAVKRAEFKLFADVGEAESPEWELQGDRIEELSLELNPNVETVTDVTALPPPHWTSTRSRPAWNLLRQAGKQALCLALQRGTGQENPHRRGKDLLLRKHLRRKRGEIRRMDTKGYCSRPVLRRQHQGATASIQHPLDWGAHLWRCGHHGRQAHLYPWIVCVGGITYGQPEHRREGGASVYRQRRESSH